MKIDFERVYFDEEGKYLIFRSKPERFYLLRVMDFNGGLRFGNTIKNPEAIESGSGVIGEYLLTKKEFDLWDTNEEAFNALVTNISKNAPADRVLKIYYQLSPEAPQKDLEVNPGQPTETDTNLVEEMKSMFQNERAESIRRFMDFVHGKEDDDIYFIYSGNMNPMFPAIDFEGKMFFAQGEKQAKLITDSTKIFNNQYRKIGSGEARDIIENCKRYGVYKILFCREDGEAFMLDRDEVLGQPCENKWSTYNSNIYNLIIRCIESHVETVDAGHFYFFSVLVMRLQEDGTKGWRQCQGIKCRNENGHSHRYTKLAIKSTACSSDERNRDEHRCHHKRNGNDGSGNLIHGIN